MANLEKEKQLRLISGPSGVHGDGGGVGDQQPAGARVEAGLAVGPSAMLLDGAGYDDDDDDDDGLEPGGILRSMPLPPSSFTIGLKLAPPQVGYHLH